MIMKIDTDATSDMDKGMLAQKQMDDKRKV